MSRYKWEPGWTRNERDELLVQMQVQCPRETERHRERNFSTVLSRSDRWSHLSFAFTAGRRRCCAVEGWMSVFLIGSGSRLRSGDVRVLQPLSEIKAPGFRRQSGRMETGDISCIRFSYLNSRGPWPRIRGGVGDEALCPLGSPVGQLRTVPTVHCLHTPVYCTLVFWAADPFSRVPRQ